MVEVTGYSPKAKIRAPFAWCASTPIFRWRMRTCICCANQLLSAPPEAYRKGTREGCLFYMVEVTGFEPAASTTRTVKALYNKGFRVIFSAFVSEIGAFQGYPTHCVHTVQVRRWSKVWSEQIFTRTRAPNRESSSSFFLPIV